MLRKILIPKNNNLVINIPNQYLNKKIEILVLPYFGKEESEIEYWTKEELDNFSSQVFFQTIDDNEDYTKW